MRTARQIRTELSKYSKEEVVELCYLQCKANHNGMTKSMLNTFNKDTLIDCFIKTARQAGAIK